MAEVAVGSTIEAVARQCRGALRDCVAITPLMEFEWAENRLDEFNLWTATTGAFAGEKASLDARLAVEWETKNLVTSILILLLGCLEKCHGLARSPDSNDLVESIGGRDDSDDEFVEALEFQDQDQEPIPRAFSPWSDQSSSVSSLDSASDAEPEEDDQQQQLPSPLQEAKAEVEQIIDHLTRLAIAIRKSGSNSRAHKADKLFKPERHQRLRDHLNLIVLTRGTKEGRDDYGIAVDSLTNVQERLIMANLRRRNRYLYAQRHARKLALEASNPGERFAFQADHDAPTVVDTDQISRAPELSVRETATERPSLPRLTVNTQAHTQLPRPVLTATSASAVVQPIEPVPPQAVTPSQVAKTNITTTTARIAYPRPPKTKGNLRYFQCPCCAQTLPEMFRQTTLWKKHLMADICPYTCIVEDCPKPDRLYVTRQEWMKHVEKEHQQCWQCPPCTIPGRPPRVFPTIKGLVNHLSDAHCNTIGEAQHSTIVASAARPVPSGISGCPLCDSNGPADSPELLDHIAEHIHAFALRSLPWAKDEDPGIDEDNGNGGDDDGYFDDDNYFDQGSEDHSQQDNVFTDSERDSEGLASLPSNASTDPARVSPPDAQSAAESEPWSEAPSLDEAPTELTPPYAEFGGTLSDPGPILPEPVTPGMVPEYASYWVPVRNDVELDEGVVEMFKELLDNAHHFTRGRVAIHQSRRLGGRKIITHEGNMERSEDAVFSSERNLDRAGRNSSPSTPPPAPMTERFNLNPNSDDGLADGYSSRSISPGRYAEDGFETEDAGYLSDSSIPRARGGVHRERAGYGPYRNAPPPAYREGGSYAPDNSVPRAGVVSAGMPTLFTFSEAAGSTEAVVSSSDAVADSREADMHSTEAILGNSKAIIHNREANFGNIPTTFDSMGADIVNTPSRLDSRTASIDNADPHDQAGGPENPKSTRKRLKNFWNRMRPGGKSPELFSEPSRPATPANVDGYASLHLHPQAAASIPERRSEPNRYQVDEYLAGGDEDDLSEEQHDLESHTPEKGLGPGPRMPTPTPPAPHPDRPSSLGWDNEDDWGPVIQETARFREPPPVQDSYDAEAFDEVAEILQPLNWGQITSRMPETQSDRDVPDRVLLKRQMRFDDTRRNLDRDY